MVSPLIFVSRDLIDPQPGIELVLYFRTIRVFLARRAQPHKSDMFYAIFSTVMLILITIWVAAPASFGQKMWLLDRNYPGGPAAYRQEKSSDLSMDFARFSLAFLQQMVDALMVRLVEPGFLVLELASFQIYRCRIVWGSRRVIVLPSILWVANLGEHYSLVSHGGRFYHVLNQDWGFCSIRSPLFPGPLFILAMSPLNSCWLITQVRSS